VLLIVFRFCKTAWPHLIARGGGSIINVASTSAKVAYKALPGIAHTAAKGGVLAMTRQLTMEGGKHNIRAYTICDPVISDSISSYCIHFNSSSNFSKCLGQATSSNTRQS
jgi:NAD(P)-dependent dehydrogenase (short-subunit alcohol dehydrogenase family)